MEYDQDKVDDLTLALLFLMASGYQEGQGARAWKGSNLEILNRLHAKGWISDPKTRELSLNLTEEGYLRSKELFQKYFGGEEI